MDQSHTLVGQAVSIVGHDRFEITAGQKIMLQAGTSEKGVEGTRWRDDRQKSNSVDSTLRDGVA